MTRSDPEGAPVLVQVVHMTKEFSIGSQVSSVLQNVDLTLRVGHLDAKAGRDLISHAGEAVFDVVALWVLDTPQLQEVTGHAAGGVDDNVPRTGNVIGDAHHLGLGEHPVAVK